MHKRILSSDLNQYMWIPKGLNRIAKLLSAKGQIVHILGFVVHMVSVTTPQLCCYGTKAAVDNT